MALAYTAPTWTDGSGQGITASQLQALCNCVEGLVQGTDKAIHGISISGSVLTITYADGSIGTVPASGLKGIASIDKTSAAGLVDTYTITYTDGSTGTFTVTNGAAGAQGPAGPQGPQGIQGLPGTDGQDGRDGADGQNGQDGADGVSVTGVTLQSTSGKVKTYRMSFSDGSHFDYEVTDGADGGGSGDMLKSVYDTDNDGVVDAAETLSGLTASITELNYMDGATENIQAALNMRPLRAELDSWTSAVSYNSSAQTFTFTGLNDSYAYDIYFSRPNVHYTNIAKTGSGTSVQLVYTVSGAQSGDTAKLRIIK